MFKKPATNLDMLSLTGHVVEVKGVGWMAVYSGLFSNVHYQYTRSIFIVVRTRP